MALNMLSKYLILKELIASIRGGDLYAEDSHIKKEGNWGDKCGKNQQLRGANKVCLPPPQELGHGCYYKTVGNDCAMITKLLEKELKQAAKKNPDIKKTKDYQTIKNLKVHCDTATHTCEDTSGGLEN